MELICPKCTTDLSWLLKQVEAPEIIACRACGTEYFFDKEESVLEPLDKCNGSCTGL